MCTHKRACENPDIDRDYRSPRYAAAAAISPRRRDSTDHGAARDPRRGGRATGERERRADGTAGFISRSIAVRLAPRSAIYIGEREEIRRRGNGEGKGDQRHATSRLYSYIAPHVARLVRESYFSRKHHSLARGTYRNTISCTVWTLGSSFLPSPHSLSFSLSPFLLFARRVPLALFISPAISISLPRSSSPSYTSMPHLVPSRYSRSRSPSHTPQSLPLLSHSVPWPRRLADSFCTRDTTTASIYEQIRGRLRVRVAAPRASSGGR